jgi:hypothetical protein
MFDPDISAHRLGGESGWGEPSDLRWSPAFREYDAKQISRVSQIACFPHGLGSLWPRRHRTRFFESC